jgi:DNA-binding NtrC family response regulator
MTLPRILVIDDQYGWDAALRKKLMKKAGLLDGEGVPAENAVAEAVFCPGQTRTATEIENDYDLIRQAIEGTPGESAKWALILLDVRFDSGQITHGVPTPLPGDDSFGITVRTRLMTEFPDLPIVMLTSKHESELSGKQYPYLSKTGITSRIFSQCLIKHGRLTLEQQRALLGIGEAVAYSPRSIELFRKADEIADKALVVVILGETGTGKELLARYIHNRSDRRNGSFVACHAAALAPGQEEAELFGIEPNIAPGVRRRNGYFRDANGGSLLLDEIGEMPYPLQVKILRALQEGAVTPVGLSAAIQVDVRIILATSGDIARKTKEGTFKLDLLRRITGTILTIPPLRERQEDIIPLADTFLSRFSTKYNKSGIWLNDDAKNMLLQHPFWGNVGELEQIMHHLAGTVGNNSLISGSVMKDALATSMSTFIESVPTVHNLKGTPFTEANINAEPDLKPTKSGVALDSLAEIFKNVIIPEKKQDLDGILIRLHTEYQYLLVRLLRNALEATTDSEDAIQPTPAIRCLLGKEAVKDIEEKRKANKSQSFTAGDAADIIKRMIKRLDQSSLDIDIQDSLVSEAVEWAKNQRKSPSPKGNSDK